MDHTRVALVTGAGRNLGRAIAVAFAQAGHDVAVNAHGDGAATEEVAAAVRALGRRAVVVLANVADEDAVTKMFASVRTALGPVDILVNNAGPRSEMPFEQLTRATWDAVVEPILGGAFYCCQCAVPGMRTQGWGRIINILGAIAHAGQPHRAHLAAAKGGLLGLTRALAAELGPHGITVNGVSPGPLDTIAPPGLDPEIRLRRAREKPIPRLGLPREVAALVTFLASEQGAFITGQALACNGGEVMLG